MRTFITQHRSPLLHDVEAELPLLILGACFIACTTIGVYLYAALQ